MTGKSEEMPAEELPPELAEAEALDAEVHQEEAPSVDDLPELEIKPQLDTSELLLSLLMPAFGLFAPNWEMQGEQCQALADAWAPVVDKYFPDLDLGVELNAVLITGMVMAPLIGKPARIKSDPEKDQGESVTVDNESTVPRGFEND